MVPYRRGVSGGKRQTSAIIATGDGCDQPRDRRCRHRVASRRDLGGPDHWRLGKRWDETDALASRTWKDVAVRKEVSERN